MCCVLLHLIVRLQTVEEFYRLQHENQTYDFVCEMEKKSVTHSLSMTSVPSHCTMKADQHCTHIFQYASTNRHSDTPMRPLCAGMVL